MSTHSLNICTDKRRTKARETAAKKAEKAAKAPAQPTKRKSAEEDEAQLDPRQYFEIRSRAIKKLKDTHDPNPYPHKFQVTTDMTDFVKEYEPLTKGEEKKETEVRIGARIYGKVWYS